MKTETCKLYSTVLKIFLSGIIKIDPFNVELYHFKVGAFFLRHSVYRLVKEPTSDGPKRRVKHVFLR